MARARKPARSVEATESLARKIWLAGIGAYGKSLEDAQGQLANASQEASRFFTELVQKGQAIEDHGRDAIRSRIDEARHRIGERAEDNTRSVEELIQRVRERMSTGSAAGAGLDALSGRVEALARMVGRVARGEGSPTPAAPKEAPEPRAGTAPRKVAATARAKPKGTAKAKGATKPKGVRKATSTAKTRRPAAPARRRKG